MIAFGIICALAMLSGFAYALIFSGRLGWVPKRRHNPYDD